MMRRSGFSKGHRAFPVTRMIIKSRDQVGEMTSAISSDLSRRLMAQSLLQAQHRKGAPPRRNGEGVKYE